MITTDPNMRPIPLGQDDEDENTAPVVFPIGQAMFSPSMAETNSEARPVAIKATPAPRIASMGTAVPTGETMRFPVGEPTRPNIRSVARSESAAPHEPGDSMSAPISLPITRKMTPMLSVQPPAPETGNGSIASFATSGTEPAYKPAVSGTERLWQGAGKVHNPLARFFARLGAGALRAADVGAESIFPREAMFIPGSQVNTDMRNRENQIQRNKEQQFGIDRTRANASNTSANAAFTNAQANKQRAATAEEKQLWAEQHPTGPKLSKVVTDKSGQDFGIFSDGSKKPLGIEVATKARTGKTFSNPFEAFAYGTPAERRAAQDFLGLEKRVGARYRQPSEIEERYRLYKQDPKAYAAMFGTKNGGGISEATATKMLNYFDRRRKEITDPLHIPPLTDAEIKQKLAEIDQLEKPFMDAAHGIQPGSNGGNGADRLPPGWARPKR